MPWRLCVPLIGKVEPVGADKDLRLKGEAMGVLQLLGELPADRVGNITSPRLSAISRDASSGITLNTSRLTVGVLRQYASNASRVSSAPGVKDTNLYGPAPTGAFL